MLVVQLTLEQASLSVLGTPVLVLRSVCRSTEGVV